MKHAHILKDYGLVATTKSGASLVLQVSETNEITSLAI
jgi:hypothetical protein